MANDRLLTKVAKAWRAGGTKDAPLTPAGTGNQIDPYWWMPGGYVQGTHLVGDGGGNSAVVACLNVLGGSFAEAPVAQFNPGDDGQLVADLQAPAAQLVANPNPYMTGELLWGWTLAADHLAGDAYWFKGRSMGGRVVELWPINPMAMDPRDGTGSLATVDEQQLHHQGKGALTVYYEYRVQGRVLRIEKADVVHLRLGVDPNNPRKGLAPVKSVLREVMADEEAGQFAGAMLRNMGVPGVVLTPADPDDPGPDEEEADAIADTWENRFGGSNRGRPLVMEGGAMKVSVVSFSPQQLEYGVLRRVPEERISAVLGVPAILAGLGAGLERATYANAETLREFFTEQKLAPLWRQYGAQLTTQLLPDFTDAAGVRLGFDTSNVRALQEDADNLWTRTLAAVTAGTITVAEFKRAVGLTALPADEVYLRSVGVAEVPLGEVQPTAAEEAERILAESS
jgi:HK97 family phage portal protein